MVVKSPEPTIIGKVSLRYICQFNQQHSAQWMHLQKQIEGYYLANQRPWFSTSCTVPCPLNSCVPMHNSAKSCAFVVMNLQWSNICIYLLDIFASMLMWSFLGLWTQLSRDHETSHQEQVLITYVVFLYLIPFISFWFPFTTESEQLRKCRKTYWGRGAPMSSW